MHDRLIFLTPQNSQHASVRALAKGKRAKIQSSLGNSFALLSLREIVGLMWTRLKPHATRTTSGYTNTIITAHTMAILPLVHLCFFLEPLLDPDV